MKGVGELVREWVSIAPMPTARAFAQARALPDGIYVFPGNVSPYTHNQRYSPSTNTWSARASMPFTSSFGTINYASGAIEDRAHLTGYDSSAPQVHHRYNSTTDTWDQRAQFNWPASGTTGVTVGDKWYVMFGSGPSANYRNVEEYNDASDSWTRKGNAPIGRPAPLATDALNGFIYSVDDVTSTAYKYDPALDAWSQMSSAGVNFDWARGGFIDGFLHVVAHVRAGGSSEAWFLGLTFDPSTDTWGSFPEPTADATMHYALALCSDGDSLYLFGGRSLSGVRTSASYAYRVVDTDPDPEPIPGTATAPLNVSIGVAGTTSRAPAFVNVGVAGKTATAPMNVNVTVVGEGIATAPMDVNIGVAGKTATAPMNVDVTVSAEGTATAPIHVSIGMSSTATAPMNVDVTVIDAGVGHAPLYINIGARKFVRVPMNVQVEVHSSGVWTAPLHANIGVTRSSTGPMLIEAATRKKSTAPMSVLYHVTGKRVTAPMLVVNGAYFLWVPDMSQVHEEIHFNTLITTFETGREQRRSKGRPRRTWTLRFRRDEVDANEIWDFYVARQGAFEQFLFVSPLDNKTYNVRFADDNLSRDVLWRAVYNFGLTLIEVI